MSRAAVYCRRGAAPLLLLVGLLLGGPQEPSPPAQRILFIGNSLTRANNLPGMVEALSRAAGNQPIATRAIVFDGFSLEDHWARGDARRAIAEGGWSVVVLQQGPSALPESQAHLREFTKRFDGEIRRAGARTALYMVWPAEARRRDFDGVSGSYTRAAADVNALLLPVGDAWRAAWRRDPEAPLYGPDRFHPSPLGSWLTAIVIYQQITGKPVQVPESGFHAAGLPALPADRVRLLVTAASDVNYPIPPVPPAG
jgi:hypothetical protein